MFVGVVGFRSGVLWYVDSSSPCVFVMLTGERIRGGAVCVCVWVGGAAHSSRPKEEKVVRLSRCEISLQFRSFFLGLRIFFCSFYINVYFQPLKTKNKLSDTNSRVSFVFYGIFALSTHLT